MDNDYFIFNNISSEDMGIMVTSLPPISKPAKNIVKVEVDGRDGFLTNDLGNYKSVLKSVECAIEDSSQIDEIINWLDGSGEVIFSNESNKKYKAVIINQIDFEKILNDFKSFIIQFDCQPHGYDVNSSLITMAASGSILNSSGKNSKPVIKIYGNGNITLTINGKVITLTGIVDYVIIDSDMVDCYKDAALMNNSMSGDFPELIPGVNNISWTGTVTKVEITPNF